MQVLLVLTMVALPACPRQPAAPKLGAPQENAPPPEPGDRSLGPATAEACVNDDHEPDDEPNINDTARRMAAGRANSLELTACPGDVDYVQGVGDFSLRASVTWDPADGTLDVALVDSDGQVHDFRGRADSAGSPGIVRAPGKVEIRGGSYRQFVRVRNEGHSAIRYRIELGGIWAE